ncbi:hypothetical protein SAVERM_3284 [Streptomyces avermitilis MA-4680 = NBRC 14893]|uniref:Uncharacterized protein n=2 Tax=Streptomyces avermitilis TaxID=33903 RepID=Q82I74_STRAW|nr:hypothetical protein SAVERM_3284 [Streptomyces avermitilis MA-4680 = NBRC 14893]
MRHGVSSGGHPRVHVTPFLSLHFPAMSWHLQPADRAPGTNGANGPGGPSGADAAHGAPSVYHPRADAAPAYEEYADPAAAHGWENAYDSTRELPVTVPDADEPAGPGGPVLDGGPRRRARPKGRGRPTSRVLVAVGAVCALGAAVAIAGFSGSGSPAGPRVEGDGVRPKAERSEQPSVDASASAGAATTGPSDGGAPPVTARPSDDASSSAGASVSPSPSGEETGAPTTSAPSTEAAVTATASAGVSASASRPGNSGHGKGASKRPK